MAVSAKDALQEEQWLSDRLSSQVRMVATALIAFTWALLVTPPTGLQVKPSLLVIVALLAILGVVADLLQYLAGYVYVAGHRKQLEKERIELGYDPQHPLYKCRRYAFWAKLVIVLGAVVVLLIAVVPVLASRLA